MSDTPKTDAQEFMYSGFDGGPRVYVVYSDFARTLEQNLYSAQESREIVSLRLDALQRAFGEVVAKSAQAYEYERSRADKAEARVFALESGLRDIEIEMRPGGQWTIRELHESMDKVLKEVYGSGGTAP